MVVPAVAGCGPGGHSGIPVPLSDGLYLRYTADLTHEETQFSDEYQFEFDTLGNGKWRLTETAGQYHTGTAQALTIDGGGTIVASDSEPTRWKIGKKFNDLWLAPSERQPGSVVRPLDDPCDYKVGATTEWRWWQVIPAVCSGAATVTRYYESSTGWFVGSELTSRDGNRTDVLSSTTASIPSQ